MTDRDNITLPREVVEWAVEALDSEHPDIQLRAAIALRAYLAAPKQEQPKQGALCWFCHGTGYQRSELNYERVPCPSCNPKEYFK